MTRSPGILRWRIVKVFTVLVDWVRSNRAKVPADYVIPRNSKILQHSCSVPNSSTKDTSSTELPVCMWIHELRTTTKNSLML